MLKKFLPLLMLPLLAGCAATFTNLTPQQTDRNPDNQYPVEVALTSQQQTLRWSSIRPRIVVGHEDYEMHPTPLMTNRWEGLLPVPKGKALVHYRYKFDFEYNAMGKPKSDTFLSPEYTLRVLGK
jgi:hypothetical protein